MRAVALVAVRVPSKIAISPCEPASSPRTKTPEERTTPDFSSSVPKDPRNPPTIRSPSASATPSTTVNAPGSYGTLGVPAASNTPGARAFTMGWVDRNGAPWLFGGQGPNFSHLNDLWRWDGASWTWMAGSSQAEGAGVYGTLGLAEPANRPGGRWSGTTWVDARGQFWLYGGYGLDASGAAGNEGALADLWRWDGAAWAWMGGSAQFLLAPVYGVPGVPGLENLPGSRAYGVSWTDGAGDFWLFGGQGPAALFNDLWRYRP